MKCFNLFILLLLTSIAENAVEFVL